MRRSLLLIALHCAAAVLGLGDRIAHAQSSDTFNDTSPGPWWQSETADATLTIAETNNRLEFSTTPNPNLTPQSFAGYAAKNWRVRSTSEIRARVKWRSFPSGTTSTVGSEAGVVFSMYPAASARQSTGYRAGLNISIGTHNFSGVGARRDFNVNYINPTGQVINIYRFWAYFTNTPFAFYNYYSGNPVGTIQYEGTFYIQYFPSADVMYVSLTGYNDPNAPAVTNVTLGIRDPQMFAVGGYGTRPGGMTGANAWLDDFFVDMGVIEAPPSSVAAEDGTNTSRVRVTWTAALNATGYRVLRKEGTAAPIVLATLPVSSLSFDDTTAVPGTPYIYTVRMITPSGDAFEVSDPGWRGVSAPTGVVATDGSSTSAVTVSWNAVTGAQQYAVFRALPPAATTEIGVATASPFEDAYADAGLTYTYTVRARTPAGDSAPSAPDTGWRNVEPPADVTASDGTSTEAVNVAWSATAGATGYRVFRAQGSGTTSEIGTTAADALSFGDTYAVPGTIYTYTVRARTEAGDSAASAPDAGWRNVPAPTGAAASDGTSTSAVTIVWNAVTGATGYRVLRASAGGPPVEIGTPTGTQYEDRTSVPGTAYDYVVRARTAAGDSAPSAPDRGWRNVTAPYGLVATDGASAQWIELRWTGSASRDGFNIYRSVGAGSPSRIGTSRGTSFRDTSADPLASYTYVVRAQAGPGESAPSNADRGWRNVPAPTSVSATDGTEREFVRVTWSASSSPSVTGYRVLRKLPGGDFTLLDALPASAAAIDDKTIAPGVLGTYVVRCITDRGDSPDSVPDTGFRPTDAATSGASGGDGDARDTDGRAHGGGRVHDRTHDAGGASGGGAGGLEPAGRAPASGADPASETPPPHDRAPSDPLPLPMDCGSLISRILATGLRSEDASFLTGIADETPDDSASSAVARPAGMPALACVVLGSGDPAPRACRIARGDVNLDGRIDEFDLADFLVAWTDRDLRRGDLNRDGIVDGRDLAMLVAALRPAAH